MSILNVNQKKLDASLEARRAIAEYVLSGHAITVCKPQRNPKSRKVSAKTKLVFGSAEPVNRPSNAWDVLLTA